MTLTTPSSPWAPPPAVICDFGWYSQSTSLIFGNLLYNVAGNNYPPAGAAYADYITLLNQPVTFDVFNTPAITGLPQTILPPGVNIVSMTWVLGNGIVSLGPLVTTTYTIAMPDIAATLTIVDSLGRTYSTTHRLNLVSLKLPGGTFGRVTQGTGRT
jgi:hypothetical protein